MEAPPEGGGSWASWRNWRGFSGRMLKKSPVSPAQPRRAQTRLFPCIVLASLRGSTYRSVRLASSLAAALLDGLFEHPAAMESSRPQGGSKADRERADVEGLPASFGEGFEDELLCRS